MFFRNQYKKTKIILLIIFLLNLTIGSLFLTSTQTQAAINVQGNYSCDNEKRNCHSCNSDGQCIDDPNGPYWCPTCFGKCSSPINPPTSGCPGNTPTDPDTGETIGTIDPGTGQITDPDTGEIIGVMDPDTNEITDPDTGETVGIIDPDTGQITNPDTGEIIGVIDPDTNEITDPSTSQTVEQILDELINYNTVLSGRNQSLMIALLMESLAKVEYICERLANAATALPFAGVALSTAIALTCPRIIDGILRAIAEALRGKMPTPHIQSIESPTFNYYKWEIGIPGLVKPGEVTEF